MNQQNNKNTGLKLSLVVVSALLVLTMCICVYLYTAPDTELQNQVNSLVTERDALKLQVFDLIIERDNKPTQEQLDTLTTERDSLKLQVNTLTTERDDLKEQILFLQNQISSLKDEVNNLKAAKLVTALAVTDQRPAFGTPYFEISGTVWNVGTLTATNCRLHVVLYQEGSSIAKDTYISLITINSESYKNVFEQIYYTGSQITNWSLIPEWD